MFGSDGHLVGLGRFLETDVRPRPAGIDRFVHAVAERTPDRVTGADIDDVGIGRRHLYSADAVDVGDLIEDRHPRHARVGGFPDAARGCPEIEYTRLTD